MSNAPTSEPPRFMPCAVTGKMVPADELVNFQGQMVSAEGKMILLDRLKAGEPMTGEMDRPRFTLRWGCSILDSLLLGVPTALGTYFLFGFRPHLQSTEQHLYSFVAQAIYLIYFALMHASTGQTLGKRAGHIKVVDLDGQPITAGTAWIRALAYGGPGLLAMIIMMFQNRQLTLYANIFSAGWGLTDCICLIADTTRQRALHDHIAGTRVIVVQ
jgi:uncharacterized RDD family membrane protein YckC